MGDVTVYFFMESKKQEEKIVVLYREILSSRF